MSSIIKVDTIQDQDGNNIINENANTITIGKSGDTVQVATGATLEGAGTQWQSSIVTAATHTATAGEGYFINTTSNACTVTLPGSASVGDTIQIVDYAGTFTTNNVTLTSSLKIEGGTNDKTLTTNREGITIVYADVTQGWVASSGINSGDRGLDPVTYTAEYLVVAGGGSGGGSNNGGGGGAGGLLTNFGGTAITLFTGSVYTATVGAGGAAVGHSTNGNDGGNSVLSGDNVTTITAIGGGGGANANNGGRDGGSGGGGGYIGSGGSGTSGQGNDGGTSSTSGGEYGAAGGGGAGAAGSAGSNSAGGNGGNGLANSITGASVTYAGGGGGSAGTTDTSSGQGGSGGGGEATAGGTATAGTNGLGGGGGGKGKTPGNSGAGGSGVVILRVPTASYSATTTGSPTVTTDGSHKVIKFTGSGTYTA
jgi:hypothetical protein